MFDDEKLKGEAVDPRDFHKLAQIFSDSNNRDWTREEANGVYQHLEELIHKLYLVEMSIEGFITLNYDGEKIVYETTKHGEEIVERQMKIKDNKAIEDLMKGI